MILAPVQFVDNRLFIPQWELRERERLDAARCPECKALPPTHRVLCTEQKLPDPEAKRCRCGCGCITGSPGYRMTHGGDAS